MRGSISDPPRATISTAVRSSRHQGRAVVWLGELAEDDDADVRVRLAEAVRDADALAVPARRHPQVRDDDIRRLAVDRLEEGVAVAADGCDHDPVQPAQHLADRLAHQIGVVG